MRNAETLYYLRLPDELTVEEAASILDCDVEGVLGFVASGELEWRNTSPISLDKTDIRLSRRSVIELRTTYRRGDNTVKVIERTGSSGRPVTTLDIATFAQERRPELTWKEIAKEWREQNPNDKRNVTYEVMRAAWRRHYGDKARKK